MLTQERRRDDFAAGGRGAEVNEVSCVLNAASIGVITGHGIAVDCCLYVFEEDSLVLLDYRCARDFLSLQLREPGFCRVAFKCFSKLHACGEI